MFRAAILIVIRWWPKRLNSRDIIIIQTILVFRHSRNAALINKHPELCKEEGSSKLCRKLFPSDGLEEK